MYTQGSHNPQPGQGPQNPLSSLYQHRPPGPPSALPHMEQGSSGFTYQHRPGACHQIPPGGLSNTGQSYLQPPMHVQGDTPIPHMHPTAQKNTHSQLGNQNAHTMPQPVLPLPVNASTPQVSQTHPPPRTVPPPPPTPQSQGQTFYRAPINPLPQHVSSLPAIPSTTSFFTSACKVDVQLVDPSLRPSENEPSEQPCNSVIVTASHSRDDSDMEMEDDITQIDDDQSLDHSLKGLSSQCDVNENMLHAEEQLHPPQLSVECKAHMEEKKPAAGNIGLGEQGSEGITNAYQVKNSTSSTEQPLATTLEKSNTSSQPLNRGSPFRLLRGYASDDNSEKDVETCVGNTSVSFGDNLCRDSGSNLENASSPSNVPCAVVSSEVVEGNKHINHASPLEVLQKENIMSGKEHREKNETVGFSQHKIDKFGRLVKNVASDSDSDDSYHIGRHRRGRTRSRSRSFSPPNTRRRRSPLKRRDKRSHSRSWSPRKRSRSRSPRSRRSRSRSPRSRRSRSRSPRNRRSRSRSPRNRRSRSRSPRNRRSRSRSPSFRRAGGFSSENKRRAKAQMPDCFDFLRGRCYRGGSCRYLHHGSGKSDESRWQRSKEKDLEFSHGSRTNVREEIKRISEKEAVHEHDGVRGLEVKSFKDFVASTDMNMNRKRQYSVGVDAHNQDSRSIQYHMVKSENSRVQTHSLDIKQEGPNPFANEKCQEVAESHQPSILDASSVGNMDRQKSCDNASQEIHTSSKSAVDQKSLFSPLDMQIDNSSISNYSPHKTSASSLNKLLESSTNQNTMFSHNHPSHIPSHSLPVSQGLDNLQMKQHQTASSVFQSSGESFPSYILPNQRSYFAPQPNPSMASLPPPPSVPPQDSKQSHLPLRKDSSSQIVSRPYPTELPAQSQSNGFQQGPYLQIQEANQPIFHGSLPLYNLPIQQCGAPSMSRDDGFTQPPMQNVIASNSFAQGNTQPHVMPFSHQMLGNKMQPFTGESLPPGGFSNTSSHFNSYSQQQPPPHSSQHLMADSNYTLNGKVNSSLKDPPNIRDTTSNHVDAGGSTGSTFPNPQTSSPNPARAIGQKFPISAVNQYDPILDSIEPSSRSSGKFDYAKKREVTGDSDMLLGTSGSNKPLDMEENNQRKDGEAVASAASADNEEFGETADAEVGAVENGSPNNPAETNMAPGEIEIDQIKSPGKSKIDKDSRSMKLFKAALADFVKEVLKPSWQQGNMSKEAFKTIVKKTVDKVSEAMKSHQIPKSRAKIDKYIESSQQKLTRLVMGYVDKYVNV